MTYTTALAARIALVTADQIAPVLADVDPFDADIVRAFLVKDANQVNSPWWGTGLTADAAAVAVAPKVLERIASAACLAA